MREKDSGQTRPGKTLRKRLVTLGLLVVTVASISLLVVYLPRSLSLEARLATAGLGRLPDSAVNVMSDTRGRIFGVHTTFIRFDAEPSDVHSFVLESTVSMETRASEQSVTSQPGVRPLRFLLHVGGPDAPPWWQPPPDDPYSTQAVFRLSQHQPYGGGVLVDYATDSVYIVLTRPSGIAWVRRYLPFI